MFPGGIAGAALCAMRCSVAAMFLIDGAGRLANVTFFWASLLFLVPAVMLCLGFLTPYCSLACGVMELSTLLFGMANDHLHLAISIVDAMVLTVLGPGAYSVDSLIFGRRLLVLPPRQ